MKGKSLIAENRQLAFQVYVRCGGNVEATLRELEKEGLALSKPTFYEWMEKYNFKSRMQEIDRVQQEAKDQEATFEESMLKALIYRKAAYEKYFDESPELDHQAQYAYAGIIKSILDIRAKIGSIKAAMFLEFMKDLISFLGAHAPESMAVIEGVFDDFIRFAKEKYGA